MKRLAARLAKILGIIAAVFAVIILVLQIVLNSTWMRSKVDSILSSVVEKGQVRYSRLHFRTFPIVVAEIDSLSVTYPHGLFSAYDRLGVRGPLLSEGRGSVEDTLLATVHLHASVNPWKLLAGKIKVNSLSLSHPQLYYHAYDGTASNLDILSKSDEPKDSVSKPFSLPWLHLCTLSISDRPRIVYTSQADTVHAGISFDNLLLSGKLRLKKNKLDSKVKNLRLELDNLRMNGRLPADTLALALENLRIATPRTNLVDLGLKGEALYFSHSLGRLQVPAELDARASFRNHRRHFDIALDHLDADIAYVPMYAEGLFSKFKDHSFVKASAGIDSCKLGTVLEKYGRKLAPAARDFRADALLNLGVKAEGNISQKEYPQVDVALDIPSGHVAWIPKEIRAMLDLVATARLTPSGALSAEVERCHLRSNGVKLDLDGDGRDLIGRDPAVAARLGICRQM